jgi:hypothetical protein
MSCGSWGRSVRYEPSSDDWRLQKRGNSFSPSISPTRYYSLAIRASPFLPVSVTVPSLDCNDISSDPPTELVVLVIDSRRWYLDADGLRGHSWFVYGASPRGDSGPGLRDVKTSSDGFCGATLAIPPAIDVSQRWLEA